MTPRTVELRLRAASAAGFFDAHDPGRHRFIVLEGYGHLDVWLGERSAEETFPAVLDGLRD